MKTISSFVLTLVLGLSGGALAAVKTPAPALVTVSPGDSPAQIHAAYAQALSPLLPVLNQADGKPLDAFEALAHQAARPGAEKERAALARVLTVALAENHPVESKVWVLHHLQFVGRAEAVPALTGLLGSPEARVREGARCALQHNPDPSAAAALRKALAAGGDPAWRAALVQALGQRRDAASVPAIAGLLKESDERLLAAALNALGDVGGPEAAQAVTRARATLPASLRLTSAEAVLKCAERLLQEGKAAVAARLYQELDQPAETRAVQLAALRGQLKCAGEKSAPLTLKLLATEDAGKRGIAADHLADLEAAPLRAVLAGIPPLPVSAQAMVLGVLAAKGERAAQPLALSLLKNSDEEIRLAAISALGRLGDAQTVPTLVQLLAAGGNLAAEARDALARITDPQANAALVVALREQADPALRQTLIETLEARGAINAVPDLLSEAGKAESKNRKPALRALGKLAGADHLPALVVLLNQAKPGGDRDEVERALASAALRIGGKDQPTASLLAAYQAAAPAQQLLLLPVLGRVGGAKSFEAIKAALASTEAPVAEAGQRALYNWPDATDTVGDALLAIVQKAEKPADRNAALRAFIRVATLPEGLTDGEKLRMLTKAMELSQRDEDRNLVLERLSEVRRIEALRLAVPCLEQPKLVNRAATAIVELAKNQGLRDKNKVEFEQALNRILAVCQDTGIKERAQRRLKGQ
jgi:HEAT repeat protein